MKTTHKLLLLFLLSSLGFQGCATYYPERPTPYYPPPRSQQKQPMETTDPISHAPQRPESIAGNFSRQAATQMNQGRLELAAATLERGLRIAPKDAWLWAQLAEVKLHQHHYQQARSLAAKSNALAGNDSALVQKNQWTIEEAWRRSSAQ